MWDNLAAFRFFKNILTAGTNFLAQAHICNYLFIIHIWGELPVVNDFIMWFTLMFLLTADFLHFILPYCDSLAVQAVGYNMTKEHFPLSSSLYISAPRYEFKPPHQHFLFSLSSDSF